MASYRCTSCDSRLEQYELRDKEFCPFCWPNRPTVNELPKKRQDAQS